MTRFATSIPPAYFDDMYAADPDPWRFAASDYEREKYAATLGALPRERYASALEVGCSIGVLTARLASRCGKLLSLDVAESALAEARRRCEALPHVSFARMRVPLDWPQGSFDLILLSEIVYYLDRADVVRLGARVADAVAPDGDVVLVHWLGETHYPLGGNEAAEAFIAATAASLRIERSTGTDAYRLDVLKAPRVPRGTS